MTKPTLESIPLTTGLRWRGGTSSGFLFQEKSDGHHEFATLAGAVVNAERMRDGSLVVNDLVSIDGQDVRREPTRIRWAELLGLAPRFPGNVRLCHVGNGGEFLAAVLASHGEGIVAKPLGAPFGAGWLKCKRSMVYFARVTGLDPSRGSVALVDRDSGEYRGRMALRSRFERVRVGSVLKVEAFGLTRKGLLRGARPDHDAPGSFLVSY